MKVSYPKHAISLPLGIVVLLIGMGFNSYGQDGSPDLYIPTPSDMEIEADIEEPALEEEAYIYEEQFYSDEERYYEEEVEADTSSVSMLTFNFLFYIVYKLKFSESENRQDNSKTADD